VEYHLAHAFAKLGVGSRYQLGTLIRSREGPGVSTKGKTRENPDVG
jgi:hypothetical protein